ncbi:hypothetical protein MEQU1_000875 [Malassezia equina]|uniref:Uncharacterized protein n=1 Tax=Malassezia equina TaxID=1381935 RepID=A0AAF0J2P9_9BASI|nr:hypothetical protein MEQU1_000875 [Malassezia equina]
MQRAWHGRRLHVDLLDYDTPDEEPMSLSMDESCMLTIHTEQGEHALTLLPCCAQEAAQASVPLLAELSLMLTASIDAAHTRQAAMEQALQAAQASLDAERVKYRERRILRPRSHILDAFGGFEGD